VERPEPHAGPGGTFLSDGHLLFASDANGCDVWDVAGRALVGHLDDFEPSRRHPDSAELVQVAGSLLRAAVVSVSI
jgi:hypothetical protein